MITRLEVRNFKSLRDINLSLGALNVLAGPNMSGKSNILDVLRFLHEMFFPRTGVQGIGYAVAQRGGISEVLWKGSDERLITIALDVRDDVNADTTYSYELRLIAGAGEFVAPQSESLKVIKEGKASDLITQQNGFTQLKNADGKDAGNMGSATSAFQYATPNWDGYRFQTLAKSWRFYHLIPPQMKESSLVSSGQSLEANGENLSAWVMWLQTHAPERFERISEILHDLFPDVTRINAIPTSEGKVYLSAKELGLKRPTNLWQMSDGFLSLIALLSLIYVPSELAGTLYCIEEPENHLHPGLLKTFVTLLRQVREDRSASGQDHLQIILTTQSPYLLDEFTLDEVIWVEKKKGETKAVHPGNKRNLKKLVDNRELGLGALMFNGALGDEK